MLSNYKEALLDVIVAVRIEFRDCKPLINIQYLKPFVNSILRSLQLPFKTKASDALVKIKASEAFNCLLLRSKKNKEINFLEIGSKVAVN